MAKPFNEVTTHVAAFFTKVGNDVVTGDELYEALPDYDHLTIRQSLHSLIRNNTLTRVGKGEYRVRQPDEKREEFKVARLTPPQKAEPIKREFNVWLDCDPDKVSPTLRQFLPQKADDRIQFLNPNTAIIWNSSAQLESFRQMALGH